MNPSNHGDTPHDHPPDGTPPKPVEQSPSYRSSPRLSGLAKGSGVQKGKPDKGRKPLNNININDIDQGSVQILNKKEIKITDSMEICKTSDSTVVIPTSSTPQSQSVHLSPSKGPCSLNLSPADLASPNRSELNPLPQSGMPSSSINPTNLFPETPTILVDPHLISYDRVLNQNPNPPAEITSEPNHNQNSVSVTSNPLPKTLQNAANGHGKLNHTEQLVNQTPAQNVWLNGGSGKPSFAEKIKRTNGFEEIKLEFVPPVKAPAGLGQVHKGKQYWFVTQPALEAFSA